MKNTIPALSNILLNRSFLIVCAIYLLPVTVWAEGPSRLPDEPKPLVTEGMVRTAPLIEAFEPFLSTGDISPGFELPTGAIWQPQLLVWGDLRSALQSFDDGTVITDEWANRLNLFAQLRLSGTERILISARPLDKDGLFTGQLFDPDTADDSINGFNGRMLTLFFEGDFGEIFPNLDPDDSRRLDWGFAIGRQPVFKQEGMLVNDNIDAIGIVRNSILVAGTSNVRVAGLYGWNEVHRNDQIEDTEAEFYGLFTEVDIRCCTVDVDIVFVDTEATAGKGFYLGLSTVQRFGHVNSSFRYLLSDADTSDNASVSTGSLLFFELSLTPTATDNNLYFNGYAGKDRYSPAALNPGVGGPLVRTGILYASVGLGSYGSPLENNAGDIFGLAIGYQMFFSGGRKQLILEVAGRKETEALKTGSGAVGARYQQAFGRHTILILDGFVADHDITGGNSGTRLELRFKF